MKKLSNKKRNENMKIKKVCRCFRNVLIKTFPGVNSKITHPETRKPIFSLTYKRLIGEEKDLLKKHFSTQL